jgi:four helix bundle protein
MVMTQINGFRDLIVFQKAYELSMEIFELSKGFPKEEKYSLTDQARRSSRSICANISESWAKRIYIKAFVNKLTDSLGEEYETETWINYAKDCNYLDESGFNRLINSYEEVRKMLISMINNPEKFCRK